MIPNFSTNAVCTWPSPCGWFSHTLSTTFPHQPLPTHCLIQWSHNGIKISEGKFPAEIDTTPCPVLRRTTTTTTNNNNNTSSRFSHNFHFCSIPTQYQPTTARYTQHPTVVGGHCPHLPSWWRQDLRKELHLPLWSQRDPRRELLPLFNHYL